MNQKKNILILALVVCLVCACQGRQGREIDSGDGDTCRAVRIAYVPTIDALPFFVAKDMGWFDNEGIEVSLERFLAQMDIDTALVGRSVDGAFTDIVRVEHMKEKFGLNLDILDTTALEWTLISNKVARLNKLEQFGDKMVAMTRFSATDSLTELAFNGVKMTAPMFKVQINDVELRLRMIDNNEMDAAWLPEPYSTRALLNGHKEVVNSRRYKTRFGVLVLREDYEKKAGNEKKAEILRRVYAMACDSIDKYGMTTYVKQLNEYCHIDSTVVNHISETKYKE